MLFDQNVSIHHNLPWLQFSEYITEHTISIDILAKYDTSISTALDIHAHFT